MRILFFLLTLSLAFSASSQQLECMLCSSQAKSQTTPRFLSQRPIQENIVITLGRSETIALKTYPDSSLTKIIGHARYGFGQNERQIYTKELWFSDNGQNGDDIPNDGVFKSDDLFLHEEGWVSTYLTRRLLLDLEYYGPADEILGTEHFDLSYIVINENFLAGIDDFNLTYLNADSSIIHTGNSIYVEFEELNQRFVSPDRHYSEAFFDEEYNLAHVYDEIWDQPFFTIPGSGSFGLEDLNSSVFSFALNGSSGNYYIFENKTGSSAVFNMFRNETFVHELFHMYQGGFWYNSIENYPDLPLFEIGSIQHNAVQFFGQSGFGRTYPISDSYPNLCPEHIPNITTTADGRFEVKMDSPCNPSGLNLVDGIAEGVHSNFELFTMDLMDKDQLDELLSFGFSMEKIAQEDGSVSWLFDELVNLSREEMDQYKTSFYMREDGRFLPYYDAACKNLLIVFHGSGKRTELELKALYMLADELIQERIQMDLAAWQQWGYNDDIYHRYISYHQATLGLGKLTNNFPVPMEITSTDQNISSQNSLRVFPNPSSELVFIEGGVPEEIRLYDSTGRLILQTKRSQSINVAPLPSGSYFLQIMENGRFRFSKLLKL